MFFVQNRTLKFFVSVLRVNHSLSPTRNMLPVNTFIFRYTREVSKIRILCTLQMKGRYIVL
jgi:hypothetical protein